MSSLNPVKHLDEVLSPLTSTSKVGISCPKSKVISEFIISHPLLIFPQIHFRIILKEAIRSN